MIINKQVIIVRVVSSQTHSSKHSGAGLRLTPKTASETTTNVPQ
jgi:hypothetical protein